MSIRKFRFDGLESAVPGSLVTLERGEETHLFRILRAREGDIVELLDGKGRIGKAVVASEKQLRLEEIRTEPVPEKRIHLYLAPPRKQKMDAILHGAAELGVWRIVPVICEFSVAEPGENSVEGRWTDVLFEACKQSGNPYLPLREKPMSFESSLQDVLKVCPFRYTGSVRETPEDAVIPDKGDIAWFVGPEGGFSPKEMAVLEANTSPLKIGKWILRVETAALAGIVRLLS